ncbi:MAG: 2'-5' RNA ligase family protein [bacterium]|nr:2'-5' RNA ligase family protein [bacterium]
MNFIRLNTAFIPSKEISEKAIELSKVVGNQADTYFILDGIVFYPHITIYPPEYPEGNIAKVLETVERITKSIKPIKCEYAGLDANQGYIGVNFKPSPDVQEAHELIVGGLNVLREGHVRDKYAEYHMEFNLEQLQNIEKYGYPGAMDLYNPHLTITRLKDETKAEEILPTIKWDIPEFTLNKIGVYKMGEHGTCRELIKEFSLR